LLAGIPASVLAARNTTVEVPIYTCRILKDSPSLEHEFTRLMRLAHGSGRGIWRNLNDPEAAEKSIPFDRPIATHDVAWSQDGSARCTGNDPYLISALPRPEMVHAIRIRYAMKGQAPPAAFEAYWRESAHRPFSEDVGYYAASLPADPEERRLVDRAMEE